jgi:homoserine O-succinyltransferase/O-acetyltransferase
MPLMIDGGRVPILWAERKSWRAAGSAATKDRCGEYIKLALINNMPDAALEDTEMQFFELLDSAAGEIPVSLKLYSLPEIPRNGLGTQRLRDFYLGINDLLNCRFDGIIMTGTEPRRPDLRDEPYWSILATVLDWAEQNTFSTVLSCLAAHAGVLHSNGIPRHPLGDKQFGVFDFEKSRDHTLTNNIGNVIRIPHSRWNEVRADALTSCGYDVLVQSADAGIDLFVKKKKNSLFVHFQGHPEYGARTLLKEYRRDVKRFLRKERETYPSVPHGYFDAESSKCLAHFRETALADPREDLLTVFPEAAVGGTLENTWHASAVSVYRNWLQYIVSRKADISAFVGMTQVGRR